MTTGFLLQEADDVLEILESGEPGVSTTGVCDLLARLDERGLYDKSTAVEEAAIKAGLLTT